MSLPLPQEPARILDGLLAQVCEELQLSATKHDLVSERYQAVGRWIGDAGILAPYRPLIYPQGSYAIGTTLQPTRHTEFDLDFVCELKVIPGWTAVQLLGALERRLREHGTYRDMVERMKRCIRLNYAGDFHLDILPAIPADPPMGTCIWVPDRKLEAFKPSNPLGYAAWFREQCRRFRMVKEAMIQPLPAVQTAAEKLPLQRAVQLLKRWRDIFFARDLDRAPRSVVLTTLAGQYHTGEHTTAATFASVVRGIVDAAKTRRIVVRNPANTAEILIESWEADPEAYRWFVDGIRKLEERWMALPSLRGLPRVRDALAELFGEQVATTVIEKQAGPVSALREAGTLRVGGRAASLGVTGGLVSTRHTFFGDG